MVSLHETIKAVGLEDGYDAWRREVIAYDEAKKNLQFVPEPYKKVTNEFIKRQEVQYNPITQRFTDPEREDKVKQVEQQNQLEVLAQNKDRSLRYEQTYNIVNFSNKLKGLENRPDYPEEKPWFYRSGKDTYASYNIISNFDLKDHHF